MTDPSNQFLAYMTETKALRDVIAEREKQRAKWGDKHDDEHDDGDLADVARLLLNDDFNTFDLDLTNAGWGVRLYAKYGTDPRKRMVIAAALLLAEIERLDRAGE